MVCVHACVYVCMRVNAVVRACVYVCMRVNAVVRACVFVRARVCVCVDRVNGSAVARTVASSLAI